MTECHMTFVVKNLVSFTESSDESFVSFCFDLAIENHHNNADQNSYSAAESYFFLL